LPLKSTFDARPLAVFLALAGGAATSAGAEGAAGGGAEGSGSIGAAEIGVLTSVPATPRTKRHDQPNRFIPAEYHGWPRWQMEAANGGGKDSAEMAIDERRDALGELLGHGVGATSNDFQDGARDLIA
jgi:hypothetical protein